MILNAFRRPRITSAVTSVSSLSAQSTLSTKLYVYSTMWPFADLMYASRFFSRYSQRPLAAMSCRNASTLPWPQTRPLTQKSWPTSKKM